MIKFLKVTVGGTDNLIPINQIITAKVGANTEVIVMTKNVGFNGTINVAEVLCYKITATTAADAAKTLEQLNAFVDLIAQAAATSWKEAIFDVTPKLPYAPTAFAREELVWS